MSKPKVFISYSWTSPKFRDQVRQWADRLAADGVEIVLDQYDLKEGHDKYAYMEKMVTDPSVTHVLMFVDKRYAEKADARAAGVGTESQIISKEIYEKVSQSKFVPVVCELDDKGDPYLPVFAGSRIYIDFSSDEAVNRNWEGLIRLLHGKPLHEKPQTGKPPAYITTDAKTPTNPAAGKFAVFKRAYISEQKGARMHRQDFLDSCAGYVDELRPRSLPEGHSGGSIIATFRKLTPIRNLILDWVQLEAQSDPSDEFGEALIHFMERLLDLSGRPNEVGSWNKSWYDAHGLFVYETFLYIVAALLKAGAYGILNSVLMGHFLRTESDSRAGEHVSFAEFYTYVESINDALLAEIGETQKLKYHSQAAELMKRNADRADITFDALKEADALSNIASLVRDSYWYPQTHYYWGYGKAAPFFLRAIQHKQFSKLGTVLGFKSGDDLRAALEGKKTKLDSFHANTTVDLFTCLAKLDTLK
jgi:hypothetical protein